MSNRSDNQINVMLNERKRRRWQFPLLLCLAILVAVGVAGIFHLPATAKTYQVTRLTCSAVPPTGEACADFFVHIHNDDCYDTHGNLVCPLPEIRPHRHTADCYTTTTELVCTIPESDGHQHTADCYTRVRGELICELPTEAVLDEEGNVLEEGHVHTDECYAWYDELICGMEEGEGAHHHDDSCYETSTTQTCGMSEILLHTHTDDCYQKNEDGSVYVDENGNRWLVCGQLQVLEHVHGAECFTTYELDDGEPEFVTTEEAAQSEEEPAEQTEEEPTAEPAGESQFVFLYDEEKLGNETDAVTTDTADEAGQTAEATDGGAAETGTQTTEGTENTENTTDETENTDGTENTDNATETENPENEDNTAETAGTENTDNTDEEKQEAAAEEAAAAVEEPHTVVYTGTRGAEKNGMTVLAEIPEGALDENAQLILSDADEDAARRQILKAVNENAAEGAEREIVSMLLTDIGFASGGEPAVLNGPDPIRVTLRAAAIRGMSAPKLFHLSGDTVQEIKDVIFDTQAGTAVFTSTTFSPFAIVDLTGEDPAEETAEETVSVSMPAQSFTGETGGVIVSVEAPEGAFPAGTTMVVSQVEMDDDTLSNVTGAVESSGEQKVVTAQAVDISFFDAEQNLIEPLLPIKVSMKSALVDESENVALVHLPETGTTGGIVPEASSAEVVTDVQVVENPDENNEIQFESNAFSVYVLVGTETITTNYITADGETYVITVTYGPEALIPAGATLVVAEIPQDSEEYAAYLAQAQSAVNANTPVEADTAETEEAEREGETDSAENSSGNADRVAVTTARFFDITILDAEGTPIEPAAPVDVKIEYAEPAETAENYQVVHFGEETEVLNPAVSGEEGSASAFDFQANSFSVYGVVGTKLIKEITLTTPDGEDVTYVVSVTYGPEAMIPEGSSLRVTVFEEGTENYTYARNAVLADKLAKGEMVDLGNFGLAAMDISILNPEGVEIEPSAPVQVDLRIKELPNVENLDDVAGSIAIQHHVETEDGVIIEEVYNGGSVVTAFDVATKETTVAEGTAVDPNSVREEDFLIEQEEANATGLETSFEAEVFSTYTISYNYYYYSKNIHYVDQNGNSLTPTMTPNFNARHQFLIYDIDGYEYDSTHVGSRRGTQIQPILRASNNNGLYYSGNIQYRNGDNWSNLNNDDVYVVYKPKTAPTAGGTPQVDVAETWPDQEDPVRKPEFTKSSLNNGNGTNTISLTITAPEKPVQKSTPADVIVVFDVSGSMSNSMSGQTRLARAKTAVKNMANTLLSNKDNDVRMALISFSTDAKEELEFTKDYKTFSGKVDGLNASGGTNWEKALQMANRMTVRENAATFVVFVTDGDPTFRVSRGNVSDANLDLYSDGTYQYYRSNQVFGEGNDDSKGRNFDFAVDQVSAIAAANKSFYAIGISNDVTKVQNLTTEAGVAADHAFIASNSTAMENAFKSITESIKSALGFGNVEIVDGITALTNAEMKVMQTVDPNSFKYYRYGGENNKYGADAAHKTEWTTRETDGCAAATYTESDGAVHWNMGEGFQLEDGVTYVVEFIVWPSQAAYDLVADLNNGIKSFGSLTDEEKAQVVEVTAPTATTTGTYALKTNTDKVEATYNRTTKSGDVVTISDTTDVTATYHEGTIQNMALASDFFTVKKNWNNALDDRTADKIQLTVTKDGEEYLHGDGLLLKAPNWTSDEQYIATGFITKTDDGRYNVREPGHEYTVIEPESVAYYWDLTADVYRPMVINGTLAMLIKTDSPTGTEGTNYYVIDGKNYQVSATTTPQLTANNDRRSNLNLKKLVTANTEAVDKVPDPDDVFTYTITITDPNGNSIWFSAMSDNENTVPIVSVSSNVTAEINSSGGLTGYYSVPSGAEFTISIKAGLNVRFINLPRGSTYSIQETGMSDGYEFVKAATSTNTDKATPGTVDGDTVTGTIDTPNNVYSTEYTNNWNPNNEIVIIKVDENDQKLAGAQFKLFKKSADRWTEITAFTSKKDADETLKVGHGLYKLEETTAPDGYRIAAPVYFKVETEGNTTTVTLTKEDGTEEVSTDDPVASVSGNKVTVKNRPFKTIQIKKIGDWTVTNVLSGVQFKLFSDEACTEQIMQDSTDTNIGTDGIITTGSDGIATIGRLPAGTYYLKEVATASGYNMLSETVSFTINPDGSVTYTTGNMNFDVNTGAKYETDEEIGIYINNPSGVELPATGGPGTALFTAIGGIMTALAGAILTLKKRKAEA